MLRQFLEAALRDVPLQRRLPAPFPPAAVHATCGAAGLKFAFRRSGALERPLLRNASRLVSPGDNVWDVGANVGWFAVAAACRAGPGGRVLAVEADIEVARLLQRTAEGLTGPVAPVSVIPMAVSDSQGVLSFSVAKRARAANALSRFGSTQTGGVLAVRQVPSNTLDAMRETFGRPNVLKIDVEGAEAAVLLGASRVLAEDRPRILCEIAAEREAEVAAILHDAGYTMFDGAADEWKRITAPEWDTIALPNEIVAQFTR